MNTVNGQLGTARLGLLGLGWPGQQSQQAARIDSFTASPDSTVEAGSDVVLTWTTTFATSASINNGVGSVPVDGSITVNPTVTTTYTLTVSDGVHAQSLSVTITVGALILSFQAGSTGRAGANVTLQWRTQYCAYVVLSGVGQRAANGFVIVNPTETTTYTLSAYRTGVSDPVTATVTVQIGGPQIETNVAGYSARFIEHSSVVRLGDYTYDFVANLNPGNASLRLCVIRSRTDDLSTWECLDFDNSPTLSTADGPFYTSNSVGSYCDTSNDTIVFAFPFSAGFLLGAMIVARFSLALGQWLNVSSPSASGAPQFGFGNFENVRVLIGKSNLGYVVGYENHSGAFSAIPFKTFTTITDGSTWGVTTQITPNPSDIFKGYGIMSMGIDSQNQIHMAIYDYLNNAAIYYRCPSATSTPNFTSTFLGPVGVTVGHDPLFTFDPYLQQVVSTQQMVMAYTQYPNVDDFTIYALKVSGIFATPSLASETVVNPSGQGAQGGAGVQPRILISAGGGTLRAIWLLNDPVISAYIGYRDQIVGSASWSSTTIYDSWAGSPRFSQCHFSAAWFPDGTIGVTFDDTPTGTALYGPSWYAVPAVGSVLTPVPNVGPKTDKKHPCKWNNYDVCLLRERLEFLRIDYDRLGCGKVEFSESQADQGEAIAFDERNVIPLPDPADGNVSALSFKVPLGYDGIIIGQRNVYTQGFNEGSGDLIWRVAVNFTSGPTRYLRDCGNILVTLGCVQKYLQVPGGLLVRSGNSVEYIVSAPNTGGSLPPAGTGFIICGLQGIFWPRRRGNT